MRPSFSLAACLVLVVAAPALARPGAAGVMARDVFARPVNVQLTPGNTAAEIESQRIALEAARVDAELQRKVLKRQHVIGALSDTQYRDGMRRYSLAIDGYRGLRPGRTGVPDAAAAQRLEQQIVDFTAASDGLGAPSVLGEVKLLRGSRGEVRLDSASLQAAVDGRLAEVESALPDDANYAPARDYLQRLDQQAQEQLSGHTDASGSVALADATDTLEEVQVAYAMMSADAWPISLVLRSEPEQAFVELRSLSPPALQFTTDTTREIIRGWFDYTVRKDGYKTIQGSDLNLVFAQGRMTCHLVPVDSPQEPLPCNIE